MRLLATGLVCMFVGSTARAAEPVDYLRDVKPVLTKHCYGCHGSEKQKAGLRLDTAAAALKGGNTGPAIIPGKPADSLIIHALTGTKDVKVMPPREPRLTADGNRPHSGLDRRGRQGPRRRERPDRQERRQALVVSARDAAEAARGEERGLGSQSHR